MNVIKEFFSGRILFNCILFAMILSVLFTLRMAYVQGLPFFSMEAGKIYLFFVGMTFVCLRLLLFVLYLLGRREERR